LSFYLCLTTNLFAKYKCYLLKDVLELLVGIMCIPISIENTTALIWPDFKFCAWKPLVDVLSIDLHFVQSYILPACLPACPLATSRIPDTNKFYIILSAFNCSTRPKFSGSYHVSYLPYTNPLSTLTPVNIVESEKEFVLCFVLMAFLSYCIVHSWILPQWVITMYKANLTFVFLCIVSVITIDNQQDATILIYLLLISSTCFGRWFCRSSGAYHCNHGF